jgi:hypothetical protein
MEKVLVSLPDDLVRRMRSMIPPRKRSEVIKDLLEQEVARRERALFECAQAVENDEALNREMEAWGTTVGDGIEPETW